MNKLIKKSAFSLVELIVVISILAILGTIAFISLQGYSESARNSTRVSDISKIKTSLELFFIDSGKYPLADEYKTVSYNGEDLWHQGIVGDNVKQILSKTLQKKPIDPKYETEYLYSTTYNQIDYQILSVLEGELLSKSINNILDNTYAISDDVNIIIEGTYNEVAIKTPNYIVPSPSLFMSEYIDENGLELDGINIKSVVIEGGDNMPNIGTNKINTSTGNLDMNLSVYEGNLLYESSSSEKINAMTMIKTAYEGSIDLNFGVYEKIKNEENEQILSYLTDDIIFEKPHAEYDIPPVNIEITFGSTDGTIITCSECITY